MAYSRDFTVVIFNHYSTIILILIAITNVSNFPFNALMLLDGQQEGHTVCKNWVLVCWWRYFDWRFARLVAPVVATTSITLSSDTIQYGDILVLAFRCTCKMAIKTESESINLSNSSLTLVHYTYLFYITLHNFNHFQVMVMPLC